MIPRITRGSSGYGALSYDHGPGRRDEHTNPHKVAGNIAGKSWKQRSAAMDDHVRRMNPKLTRPIIRTSLRLAPDDRALTDREWRNVAEQYVHKMGYADSPWEAVRHADDHIHLTMSRVKWDGGVVDQWQDKTRAQSAVRTIERHHNLVDASARYNRDTPQVSRNDRERAARKAERTGVPVAPEKTALRDKITAAERSSNGTRASYESELSKQGVQYRANVSLPTERNPDGKMNGYSYGLDGHRDAHSEQVWFKGSQLGKQYGWSQQQQRLDERTRTQESGASNAGGFGQQTTSAASTHGAQSTEPYTRDDAREAAEHRAQERLQTRTGRDATERTGVAVGRAAPDGVDRQTASQGGEQVPPKAAADDRNTETPRTRVGGVGHDTNTPSSPDVRDSRTGSPPPQHRTIPTREAAQTTNQPPAQQASPSYGREDAQDEAQRRAEAIRQRREAQRQRENDKGMER